MGMLFMMPSWSVPSELWMQHMLEALAGSVRAIATYAPQEAMWRDRIPTWPLAGKAVRCAGERMPLLFPGIGHRALLEYVAREDVSCVFCHYANFALRFERVWQCTDKPLFVHCHGYDVTWDLRLHPWPHPRRYPRNYLLRLRRLAQRATLIANSDFTRRRLIGAGVPTERVVTNHLGAPVPGQMPSLPSRHAGVNVLYLGRLVDFKGPDLTLQAFERACQRGLRGTLTIAGDGPLRKRCERLRATSAYRHRIRLLGPVGAEPGKQLREQADIFTAHNRRGPISGQEEAFGVSLVEAMAAGIPVVTARSGGVTETIEDGVTGVLIEPGDVEAHATALFELGLDRQRRGRLGKAGWQRARARFQSEQSAARLVRLLQRCGQLPKKAA